MLGQPRCRHESGKPSPARLSQLDGQEASNKQITQEFIQVACQPVNYGSPSRVRMMSSTLLMVCGVTLPKRLINLLLSIDLIASHLMKVALSIPPSGGSMRTC